MGYKFGQRSLDNLKNINPKLVLVLTESIKTSPVDFTVVEGLRSTERQQFLFSQGRTRKGTRVTNADGVKKLSNHQDEADGKKDGLGSAVDLFPFFLGEVQVAHKDTIKNLKIIAEHIKETAKILNVGIVWGGDWKNPYDPPHFQIKSFLG